MLSSQCVASPVCAHEHLYFVSTRGVVSVVATGNEFKEVHSHELGEPTETAPAIDLDSIYIRTEKHLIAFRSKK